MLLWFAFLDRLEGVKARPDALSRSGLSNDPPFGPLIDGDVVRPFIARKLRQ